VIRFPVFFSPFMPCWPSHYLDYVGSVMQTAPPNVIRTLPLFTGLSEQEKDALLQAGKIRHCDSGQRLFVYGDAVRCFYIICDGAVQLFRETPEGHEMTSDVLIAGDTIGETEILQSQPAHKFNAIAVKETTIMEFPIAWLKENARRHSILALNLLAMLSRRIDTAVTESEHKSTMSAAQQVGCFLGRLCIFHDYDPHGFDLPYSKTLIASRLGMELETFSRALTKIREHGISVIGSRVSFHDIDEMEGYVCACCAHAGHCKEHKTLREKSLTRRPAA
jgi:CRP/FNR family transcriptional regulator, dissimilatory nitrate respiration regulator